MRDLFLWGYLPDDARHVVKTTLTYQWTRWLTSGMTHRYYSGRPYSRRLYNAETGGYDTFRSRVGVDPGTNLNDPGDDRALRLPDLQEFKLQLRASCARCSGGTWSCRRLHERPRPAHHDRGGPGGLAPASARSTGTPAPQRAPSVSGSSTERMAELGRGPRSFQPLDVPGRESERARRRDDPIHGSRPPAVAAQFGRDVTRAGRHPPSRPSTTPPPAGTSSPRTLRVRIQPLQLPVGGGGCDPVHAPLIPTAPVGPRPDGDVRTREARHLTPGWHQVHLAQALRSSCTSHKRTPILVVPAFFPSLLSHVFGGERVTVHTRDRTSWRSRRSWSPPPVRGERDR